MKRCIRYGQYLLLGVLIQSAGCSTTLGQFWESASAQVLYNVGNNFLATALGDLLHVDASSAGF